MYLVRHSLNFCGWKDRKAVAKDLKRIYQATDDKEAEKALVEFEAKWCTFSLAFGGAAKNLDWFMPQVPGSFDIGWD